MYRLAQGKRILVLGAHTDDAEFGCGGTIAKMVEEEAKVFCVAFSAAEESIPDGMPRTTTREEAKRAILVLGLQPEQFRILQYPVRRFPEYRQAILDDMIGLRDELHPDLVFLPSAADTHQDHQIIATEGFRAFKKASILGYEIHWNIMTFTTNCFVKLTDKQLAKKVGAVSRYISQLGRPYVDETFIRSWARMRGGQIATDYAEAFEVVRWVWA